MEIKPLRKENLEAVVAVFMRAYQGWTAEEARKYLEKFHGFEPESCLCAIENGKVCGAVLGYSYPRQQEVVLFIQELFVEPSGRQKGVGRRLVEALRNSFLHNPRVTVTPLVKAEANVLSFYNSLGFEHESMVTFYDD